MSSKKFLLAAVLALVARNADASDTSSAKALQSAAQFTREAAQSNVKSASEDLELRVATSLVKADMPLAALKQIEKIINVGKSHSQYQNATLALADLAPKKEIEPLLAQLLMRAYDKDTQTFDFLDAERRQYVSFVLANRLFKTGKVAPARSLAETITAKHPRYAAARYLLALDDLSLKPQGDTNKNYDAAIAHFEDVRKAIASTETKLELLNLRNMATLGMARAYYEQGYALPEDNPSRRTFSKKAIELYREIPRFSKSWDHALFEMGWAYTIAEEYGDALGTVRSLAHPYFTDAYYPEAEILSAIVYWYNCQWDRANRALKTWNDKYLPLQKNLKDQLAMRKKSQEWNDLAGFPSMLNEKIKGDPQYVVFETLINSMKQEQETLSKDDSVKSTALAASLNDYYAKATSDLKAAAKNWSEQTLKSLLADLESVQTRGSIISLETKTAETQWLEDGRQIAGLKRNRLARPYIPVDRDQFWWVSNNESWKDELGFYRLSIKSECYE